MSSMPKPFSRWRAVPLDGHWRVVNDEGLVVADRCTLEDAGAIASAHNQLDPIRDREDWLFYRDPAQRL